MRLLSEHSCDSDHEKDSGRNRQDLDCIKVPNVVAEMLFDLPSAHDTRLLYMRQCSSVRPSFSDPTD